MFDLRSIDATAGCRLRPIGGHCSCFSKTRILAGGQHVADMDMYNRVHELFNIYTARDSRNNDFAEGFANWWENQRR